MGERLSEYQPSPLERLVEQIPQECRPTDTYLTIALRNFQIINVKSDLDPYLIQRLQRQKQIEPSKIPVVIEPELGLVLTLDNDDIVAMIPCLGCSIGALSDLCALNDPDEYMYFSSDNTWIPQAIAHAEAGQRWTYDSSSIAPEEYLTAAITTFENEPLKKRFRLRD